MRFLRTIYTAIFSFTINGIGEYRCGKVVDKTERSLNVLSQTGLAPRLTDAQARLFALESRAQAIAAAYRITQRNREAGDLRSIAGKRHGQDKLELAAEVGRGLGRIPGGEGW